MICDEEIDRLYMYGGDFKMILQTDLAIQFVIWGFDFENVGGNGE